MEKQRWSTKHALAQDLFVCFSYASNMNESFYSQPSKTNHIQSRIVGRFTPSAQSSPRLIKSQKRHQANKNCEASHPLSSITIGGEAIKPTENLGAIVTPSAQLSLGLIKSQKSRQANREANASNKVTHLSRPSHTTKPCNQPSHTNMLYN